MKKRVYRISEFCEIYGICRTSAYAEIKSGRLKFIKFGKSTRITDVQAEKWLLDMHKRQFSERIEKYGVFADASLALDKVDRLLNEQKGEV